MEQGARQGQVFIPPPLEAKNCTLADQPPPISTLPGDSGPGSSGGDDGDGASAKGKGTELDGRQAGLDAATGDCGVEVGDWGWGWGI